jgi:hypothetical protein
MKIRDQFTISWSLIILKKGSVRRKCFKNKNKNQDFEQIFMPKIIVQPTLKIGPCLIFETETQWTL